VPRYQLYSFYNRNTTFCRVPKNYLSDRGLGFPVTEINPLRSGVKLEKTLWSRRVSFKAFIAHLQLKTGCIFRVRCYPILSQLNLVLTFKMQFWGCILILFSNIRLGLPNGLPVSVLHSKNLHAFFVFTVVTTCIVHLDISVCISLMCIIYDSADYLLYDIWWDLPVVKKRLKITPIWDKLLEYKRKWMQHVNRMPRNRLPGIIPHLAEKIMADLWRDFWIRETGTGQQVAQLHDRYMMMMMMMMMMIFGKLPSKLHLCFRFLHNALLPLISCPNYLTRRTTRLNFENYQIWNFVLLDCSCNLTVLNILL